MLTNPRTVCFCHPVACIISVSVAPLARVIIAMTSAFLLLRWEAFSPVGLPDAFLAALTFLAGFPAVRAASGFSAADSFGCPFPASDWIADHTRATAFLRSWNFFTGGWAGIAFQIPMSRLMGQSVDTLARVA